MPRPPATGALKKGEAALAGVSDMISKIASNEDLGVSGLGFRA